MVKVLFSDNNSDDFEWNWLILGTLIDIYVRYHTKQKLFGYNECNYMKENDWANDSHRP